MKWASGLASLVIALQVIAGITGTAHADPDHSADAVRAARMSPSHDRARAAGCILEGPARQYAPTIESFGRLAYTTRDDDGYWDGRGYLFGFERQDRESMMSHAWGGYLVGGIVLAENEGVAARDFQAAITDWPRDWYAAGPVETVSTAPTFGAETVVLRRLSTWEIDNQQPMTEVFLAMRYCNLNAHFMLATMPEFDALAQAVRYASIIQSRIER